MKFGGGVRVNASSAMAVATIDGKILSKTEGDKREENIVVVVARIWRGIVFRKAYCTLLINI